MDQNTQALDQIDKGVLALRDNRLEDAEASFNVAFELAQLPAALDGLGCVSLIKGDLDIAEQYFTQAYEMDSEYNTPLGHLALIHELKGETLKADRLYKMALEEEPENFRARNNYAVLVANDDQKLALNELLRAKALVEHPVIDENIKRLRNEE